MRISPAVRDRLDRLQSTGDPREAVRLLQEIGTSGEPAALSVLQAFLLTDDPAVAEAAAGAAGRLLAEVPPAALPALDAQLRRQSGFSRSFPNRWELLRRGDVERLDPVLSCLAASHHSGFVREAAVRRLARAGDGRELAFLLVRVNDWTPIVAEAARAAVEARLHPGYAPHLVNALPLLLRLEGPSRRRPSGPLVKAAVAALRSPAGLPALLDGLAPHRDREVRRACFPIALDALPPADVVGRGLADPDPAIRVRAARHLADVPLESRQGLAERARQDSFFPVRRLAFEELLRGEDPDMAMLEEALLDRSPSIRTAARRLDGGDLSGFYREALARGGATTAGALAGLGENGAPEDALLALPYLRHPSVRVRTAAARAIGGLDAAGHAAVLLEVVATGSRRPAAEAAAALEGVVSVLGARALRQAFAAAGSHGRVRLLALIARLPKWESLAELLEAAARGDEPVVLAVRERILDWLAKSNRSFTRPSPAEIERARAALAPLRSRLPDWTARQLDLALSTAAPAPAGRQSPRARGRS